MSKLPPVGPRPVRRLRRMLRRYWDYASRPCNCHCGCRHEVRMEFMWSDIEYLRQRLAAR